MRSNRDNFISCCGLCFACEHCGYKIGLSLLMELTAMANKKSNQKKPKQQSSKTSGQKGGSTSFDNMGSPSPVRKPKKKK